MAETTAIAHRGDWSVFPENTAAAFAAAVRAGADMIEIDVRCTADGAAVVLHDPTLERIWGVARDLTEMTLDEVRAVEGDRHGIPELADVLAAVELPLMVDFTRADAVKPALESIEAAGALDRALFSGGNVEGHRLLRALAPDARIALTWTHPELPAESLLDELGVEYLNSCWEVVERDLVVAMHERGTLVSTWTIDEVQTMAHALDLGVDAVVTNEIGSLVALRRDRDRVGDIRC